ncbi:MAG: YeeE/YedE family protein, partial [Meiothermus sp.]|nr:YeeE/YedE family protein [Meiothermus sp.]
PRLGWRVVLAAVLGGLLMGYGARLAYGCNIGAYIGGVASFSLHGWVWLGMALLGTGVGLRLRPWFGLSNPKPTDTVC